MLKRQTPSLKKCPKPIVENAKGQKRRTARRNLKKTDKTEEKQKKTTILIPIFCQNVMKKYSYGSIKHNLCTKNNTILAKN